MCALTHPTNTEPQPYTHSLSTLSNTGMWQHACGYPSAFAPADIFKHGVHDEFLQTEVQLSIGA